MNKIHHCPHPRSVTLTLVEADHREPGVPPLPSSAGQVGTGPAIFNQLDLFLPPCPITSRYNVIPAGYNGRVHADF